ncbi:MAG: mannose-6-phosphate isomerase, class I [Archangium sp.]
MRKLTNKIQNYAWGSLTAIPELLGVAPTGAPQAELWLGAHPSASSSFDDGQTLEAFIASEPSRILGAPVASRFGGRLPFLLKVLAAAQPLSLQAHPSLEQARAGFAAENAAGVPLSASHRNYKDANHKPEIICALTEFHALCGFRRVSDTIRFFRGLGLDVSLLEREGLSGYFKELMSSRDVARIDTVLNAAPVPEFAAEQKLAHTLAAKYPGDVGVIGALLLNLVVLKPGQALYLDAGNLHAYLEGTGIELMANSDNVLRGGLTPKHVDVNELLKVLNFSDGPANVLRDEYVTPVPDFRLARLQLEGQVTISSAAQILLVTEGTVRVGGLELRRGESVFIGADENVTLSGRGTVFRATSGL